MSAAAMVRLGRLLRQIGTSAALAKNPEDFKELELLRDDMLKAMGRDAPEMGADKVQRKGQPA